MTKNQEEYRRRKLKSYAGEYNLSEMKMARLLLDINHLKDFWWVNADEFLNRFLITEEDK